jgi:hypothetical protein
MSASDLKRHPERFQPKFLQLAMGTRSVGIDECLLNFELRRSKELSWKIFDCFYLSTFR